jgi:hypothetical protein
MTARPLRVVLADDHPMYWYGVAAVLATTEEIELVGEASDGPGSSSWPSGTVPTWSLPTWPCPGPTA